MTAAEKDLLNSCIAQIVSRYFPEKASTKRTLGQRDLNYLSDLIEEKTNIRISLSTMKRLWKRDFSKMPHPSTLDALVSLLDFENWNVFRQNQGNNFSQSTSTQTKLKKRFSRPLLALSVLGVAALTFLLISLVKKKKEIVIPEGVSFFANKTVAFNVPNSVIFSYDLAGIEADSFFIQRSWNPMHKSAIRPEKKNFSEIYYYPGFHWAKLIANDSVIKKTRVHVKTDGWFATAKSKRMQDIPLYPNQKNIISEGNLKVEELALQKAGYDPKQNLILSFFNIREFENLQSQSFILETRAKFEDVQNLTCPYMEVTWIDEKDVSWVGLIDKGCESNLNLKLSDTILMGTENDFSKLGAKLDEWQTIKIICHEGTFKLYLNDILATETEFAGATGKIMGLVFTFTGKGAIDYVSLKDINGKVLYSDEFNDR